MSEINSVPLSIREESFPNRRSSVFHNKPRNSSDTVTIRLSKSETDLAENERRLNCSVNTNVVSIMRSEVSEYFYRLRGVNKCIIFSFIID